MQGDIVRISGYSYDIKVVRKLPNPNRVEFDADVKIYLADGVHDFYKYSSLHVGCYVLGSYDGRKWAMLGGNEKKGKFTDIGCKIERTDVKFFRVCLAGQVTGKTRVDYMEMSSAPSMLNTKIR